MSQKIAVVLELTEKEAEMLKRLTMASVSWYESGEFGDAARAVFYALMTAGVGEANYVTGVLRGFPRDRKWFPW